MSSLLELACSQCGRLHAPKALACALCGNMLRHEKHGAVEASPVSLSLSSSDDSSSANALEHMADGAAVLEPALPSRANSPLANPHDVRFDALRKLIPTSPGQETRNDLRRETIHAPARERLPHIEDADARRARRQPWLYLGIGLVTAPVFALTPILGYMGWFLASLVHEMGHAAIAWLFGMPAIPAISLAGEAAAVHSEQSLFLVAMIALGLAAGAWHVFDGRVRWIATTLVVVVYPVIALTGAKELLHLLAGHGAELAFASMCLWKTLDGGFTDSKLERGMYGTIGWYLLGKNVHLCFGLMHSADARAEYNENGSFGLTNDYLRVAEDVLSCPLERVALMMLIASLLVLPAAFLLWRLSRAMRQR